MTPIPTDAELRRVYEWTAYHAVHYPTDRSERYRRTMAALQRFTRPPGRVLDFGAGTGVLLQRLLEAGYEAHGLEYEQSVVTRLRARTPAPVWELASLMGADLKFDAIVMHDVLAHLPGPADTLRALEHILAADGVMVVAGPLEENPSLVHSIARLWRHLRGERLSAGLPAVPPTMLVRTDHRSMRRFFDVVMGYDELAFEVLEDGWPYRVAGRRPSSVRDLVRHLVGLMAVGLHRGLSVLSVPVGNRFVAVYRPCPSP
ncbi:MAG TPA: methyltransferase domain-containing protein [Solirubrobacteraceae bacterium]|nr:methyltransferase domain-containing protein [Solirubrobacteraceae bacterium]